MTNEKFLCHHIEMGIAIAKNDPQSVCSWVCKQLEKKRIALVKCNSLEKYINLMEEKKDGT